MRFPILFTVLLLSQLCTAQNLVINGGFERQSPPEAGTWQVPPRMCAYSSQSAILNTSALAWRTFDEQTPDLLEWDSTGGCPMFPKPRKGNRMVGLVMYHPFQDGQFAFDYHELIQGTLAKPMEKGKTYSVSFWVYTNDSLGVQHLEAVFGKSKYVRVKNPDKTIGGFRPIMCGNFGFYFSNNKIQSRELFMQSQIDFPVKPQLNYAEIVDTKGAWQKIKMSYTATETTKYFLFGNFFSDAVTPANLEEMERMKLDERNEHLSFWEKKKRIAYYLFDDFAIVEDTETTIEQALLQQKSYTFQSALLFDTGKSDLKPEAQAAIDGLAAALTKNPTLKIEIGGHTDNVGDDASNQTLSEKRARAVYDALLAKQLKDSQIVWKGYGEAKPVATNDTDAGRQQNRRVECKVR